MKVTLVDEIEEQVAPLPDGLGIVYWITVCLGGIAAFPWMVIGFLVFILSDPNFISSDSLTIFWALWWAAPIIWIVLAVLAGREYRKKNASGLTGYIVLLWTLYVPFLGMFLL